MVLDSTLADAKIRGDIFLGWPARTSSMIGAGSVRFAMWFAAASRQADSLLEITRLLKGAPDARK